MPDVTLEIPPELLAELNRSAERNGRTLNSEIIWLLATSAPPLDIDREEIKRQLDHFHNRLKEEGFEAPTAEEIHEAIHQGRL